VPVIADVSHEGVRTPLSGARIAATARAVLEAEGVTDALLSITLLTSTAMARLNRRHLAHRGPTDVISFGFDRTAAHGAVIGDIYICPAVARANAVRARTGVREEVARLVVHGTLHVLGYDHPAGETREHSRMWQRQEALLAGDTRAVWSVS